LADKLILELDAKGNLKKTLKDTGKQVDKFAKESSSAMGSFKRAFEVAAGVVGGAAIIGAFQKLTSVASGLFNTFVVDGVAAANVQEDAINSLNTALIAAGEYSEEASQGIQDFASALQAQTIIGDEAIIQGVALAQTYVKTADEAKELTKTALDFAAAADLSFTEAIRRLGRGVQGSAGDLANFSPAIRKLTKEQLAAGEATRILADEFAGSAAAKAKTYSGAIAQMGNVFGDLQEEVGFAITQNPALQAVIQTVTDVFGEMTGGIKGNRKAMSGWVTNGILFSIKALEIFMEVIRQTHKTFLSTSKGVIDVAGAYWATGSMIERATGKSWGYTEAAESAAKKSVDLERSLKAFDENATYYDKITASIQTMADAAKAAGEITDEESERLIDGKKEETAVEQEATDLKIARLIAESEMMVEIDELRYFEQIEAHRVWLEALRKDDKKFEKLKLKDQAALAKYQTKVENQRLKEYDARMKEEKAIEKDRMDAGKKALSDLATFQNAKSNTMRAIGKTAAITSTIIETYSGAQKAYSSLAAIPFIGPALGIAAAAAAIAAGLGRVAAIRGTPLQTGMTEVPSGFPNDSFAARLTSGERVVNVEQNKDLTAFLQDATGIGPRLDTLIAVIKARPAPVVNVGGQTIVDVLQDEIDSGRALAI